MEDGLRLVAEHAADAEFLGRRDPSAVQNAERWLGVRFPPTYKLFLEALGAGDIAGEEFYGLTREDGGPGASIPNAVWLTLEERKSGLPDQYVIVGASGDGAWYALDTSQDDGAGESPIVACTLGASITVDRLAGDFGAFFLNSVRGALARS